MHAGVAKHLVVLPDVLAHLYRHPLGELMIGISFMFNLHDDAIRARHDLAGWVAWFNAEHDAFTDRDDVTWDDIYTAIATDYFSGGEHAEFVASSGTAVMVEDGSRWEPHDRCPGTPHSGHTYPDASCPLNG